MAREGGPSPAEMGLKPEETQVKGGEARRESGYLQEIRNSITKCRSYLEEGRKLFRKDTGEKNEFLFPEALAQSIKDAEVMRSNATWMLKDVKDAYDRRTLGGEPVSEIVISEGYSAEETEGALQEGIEGLESIIQEAKEDLKNLLQRGPG